MTDEQQTPAPEVPLPQKSEPILNLPPATRALVLANLAVFLAEILLPEKTSDRLVTFFGFVPARYTGHAHAGLAALVSPVTHMFLHGGWLHIGVNVTALMAFGAGVEKVMGAKRMLLFYFLTGLAGALLHALVYPASTIPMIGASGAISGLFGGVLIMMADAGLMGGGKARVKTLLPVIALWLAAAVFFGYFGMPGVNSPIAWTAHVGGFIAGLLLFKPCLRLVI
ncbi:MAG: rhomboid family intramembrane serine protease [Alphaproteobacteria bacterium]|nr:rhomboid family intramembrane serine protease [Alphaproteobacteria bacterium]MDE2336287.1 rhomboid family intramembrane serine protease [Alphaproteobacteria bacterium]